MKRRAGRYGGISSAAVHKATGLTWLEWLAVLDRAGARRLTHREIVKLLQARRELSEWWRQMVAVGYSLARGLRVPHQRAEGFEISVARTIAAPVDRAYAAFREASLREQWLPRTSLTVRKATPHKSIRIAWADGTSLRVNFWPKGPLKCQVVPEHGQLTTPEAADRMKAFWTEKLEALRAFLER
ncbi:MAG TPA: hypothetical protein VL200_03725 [Lacunisphaera sp.]|jgi:hypothetical protein|nr:hypothetical protein [Lacunisphaera sp.]